MQEFDDKEERSSLKKLQTYIPGFQGYSQIEDVKSADRMLRMLLSQKLLLATRNLEEAAVILEEDYVFDERENLNSLMNSLKRMSSEVGYASSGFSWLASDIEIKFEEAERLCEYDGQLLDQLSSILKATENLKEGAGATDKSLIKKYSAEIRARIAIIEDLFRKRMLVFSKMS